MTHQLELVLVNREGEIGRIQDQLEEFASQHACAGPPLHQVQLSLEEHLTNIIRYAYDDPSEHRISVLLEFGDGQLRIEVSDDGRPFNPLTFPEPNLSLPIEKRPIGGLGIHMLRKSMDQVEYRREGQRNILVMSKRF